MHRRIQYFPFSTGNNGVELQLPDWVLAGNDEIERRLLDKREAARDNGYDFDAALLWMPIGATMNYREGEVPRRGRYGVDGVTDGRREANGPLDRHIFSMPELIHRFRREHCLSVIAYLGCPRYTNALVALRDAMISQPQSAQERQATRAAYRQFWIDNLRPFKGAEIALDAMASAAWYWDREFDRIYDRTGSPAIVEGSAPPFGRPPFARDTSIISMMRNEMDREGQPTLDRLAAWPGPERIALFSAAEDWDAWAGVGDRRAVIAKCEAAGVSVCCDWSAV